MGIALHLSVKTTLSIANIFNEARYLPVTFALGTRNK